MNEVGFETPETRELVDVYLDAKTNFLQLEIIETETLAELTAFERFHFNRRYQDGSKPHGLEYEPVRDTRARRKKLKANQEWVDCLEQHRERLKIWQNTVETYVESHGDGTKKQAIRTLDHEIETSHPWFGNEIASRLTISTESKTPVKNVDGDIEERQNEEPIRRYIVRRQPRGSILIAEILDTSVHYVRSVLTGRPENSIAESVKKAVRARDNQECVACGKDFDLKFHHIIPVSEGGNGDTENVALLCHDCHVEAHGGHHWDTVYDSVEDFWKWADKH